MSLTAKCIEMLSTEQELNANCQSSSSVAAALK
jgi:hypothetical protein